MIFDVYGTIIPTGGNDGASIDYDSICKSVAHRGYSIDAPENTIPAFKRAKVFGFNYVETDIRFTSDGTPVCIHDDTINRTARNSDGSEILSTVNISDITYQQALTYDFGVYKSQSYAGTNIPTLYEFLTVCKNLGLKPYIELKEGTEAQVQSIVDSVNAYGLKGKATYISFSIELLTHVKNYDPYARLGFLDMSNYYGTKALEVKTDYNEVFYDTSHPDSNDNINRCKAAKIPMEVWTVASAASVLNFDPYITGITTNGNVIAGKVLYEANISG